MQELLKHRGDGDRALDDPARRREEQPQQWSVCPPLTRRGNDRMTEKFDPAPPDKHAQDPKQNIRRDKAKDDELQKGLKDSFPASDPISSTQASEATPD